ncbi:polysaccharide deacetylase family protein [Sinisalibacter aestuarii]|uniref:Chitooligosaccharide deacetylase n=1 Tax=Sinisalibacter aestuarii TaxID=2949426 RepID=A0ABQ5LT98_9RHOB|nr:polysaccharide deacetylase family protein [Sinisalibacter aestuarii]GKY88149.1 hypothetical protein STA1M1_20180 [Sinisalibacter aestuarii]
MAPKTLDILCYHAVSPGARPLNDYCFMPVETFRAHMRWLRGSRFDVLPLKEAAAALAEGRLKRRTVAITFDDGFRNNATVALPVLEEFGLPATIFLSTGFIGTQKTTWAARVTRALIDTQAQALDYGGKRLPLTDFDARAAANREVQRMIKAIAPANPQAEVAAIETQLGVPVDPDLADDADFAMMSAAEVARVQAGGLVDFGGHSVSHPILSALDDAALADEVTGSVKAVAALTQSPCETFAYPNGQPADFDDRALELLRKAGVTVAATTTQLVNKRGADPLRLNRWVLGGGVQVPRLKATLMGLHPNQIRHRLRGLTSARA